MKTPFYVSVLVIGLFALVGCSSGSDASDGTSSDPDTAPLFCQGTIESCHSYSAMPNDERSQWCTGDGDALASSCPTDNVEATCTYTSRLGQNVVTWYTDTTESTAHMQSFCDVYGGTLVVN